MVLEQTVKEVSNRYPTKTPSDLENRPYLDEIKKATQSLSEPVKETEDSKTSKDTKTKTTKNPSSLDDHLQGEIDRLRDVYSLLESQNTAKLDYEGLLSYLENQAATENFYADLENKEGSDHFLSDQEAEKMVQKIQWSYLTGSKESISFEEKEKFHRWQELNKSLLMLYHVLSPIRNDNVDYSILN